LFDQVRSFETFGCLVELSDQLTALVPPLHLADIELKKPASKFKPGSTLKCRVHTAFECSAPVFGALTVPSYAARRCFVSTPTTRRSFSQTNEL
jgi:hypothetical protein